MKILSKYPSNCNAHYLLAKSFLTENKKEQALKEFLTIREVSQFSEICKEIPFRDELSALFLHFGNYQEALKEILILIKLKPESINYLYQAGKLFSLLNKHSKAIGFYKKVIKLNPEHLEALNAYGKIMYQTGDLDEAKKALKRVTYLDDDNAQAHYYLGRLLRDFRDYSGSLLELDKASLNPKYRITALLEKGFTYFKMHQFDNAVTELEKIVSRALPDSKNSEILNARYLLGLCFEHLREIDKALDQWELINKQDSSFRDVHGKLLQYREMRDDDLIKEFHTATAINFEKISIDIVEAMKFTSVSFQLIDNGAQITAYNMGGAKFKNRQQLYMFYIIRSHKVIESQTLKNMYQNMREAGIRNGYFISSTSIAPSAVNYAVSHSIETVQKDQLRKLLEGCRH